MGIFIDSIAFTNELGSQSTDWALWNVGDKITATINISVKTYIFATVDAPLFVNSKDGYVGDGWVVDKSGTRFADVHVGDTLYWYNVSDATNTTFTVVGKLSDSEIQLDQDFTATADDYEASGIIFSVMNDITGMKFKFNQKENDDTPDFFSLVTGQEQCFAHPAVDAASATVLTMIAQGGLEWQMGAGSCTVKGISQGVSNGVYTQKFQIVHTFIVTPFFLADQLTDILQGDAPAYFLDSKCLKYLYRIEALYDINDPNRVQVVEESEVEGNTGWFDENFNGIPTNYEIVSTTYKDASAATISGIELTEDDQTVEIVVRNTADTPFTTSSKFVLNIISVPETEDEYLATGKKMDANFLFDRALQTVGAVAVNGDQYGVSGRQIIKTLVATLTSSSEILITATLALDADIVADMLELDNPRFMLWVSTQDAAISSTSECDRVSLLIPPTDCYINTTDSTMLGSTTQFLRHPHTADADLIPDPFVFPVDELVAVTDFYIDKTNSTATTEIIIKRVTAKIKAKNTVTEEDFTLQSWSRNLASEQIVGGLPIFTISEDTGYHIPTTEPRRNIELTRESGLDVGDSYYYRLSFPFMFRWEYWKALAGVDGDFYDQNESNNGFNHFWNRYYDTALNWAVYYEFTILATKDGELQTYTEEIAIENFDFDSNSNWSPNTIKTYDDSDDTELYSATTLKRYVLGYRDTRIEAEFTKVTGTPDTANLHAVIGIEVYEEGGVLGRRRLSSVHASDGDSWLKSVDTTNKVKITVAGQVVKAECLIDYTKIPVTKPIFTIYARLYEINDEIVAKLTEDGLFKLTEDNDLKILEA